MDGETPQLKKRKMSLTAAAPMSPPPDLLVKRLSEKATLPTRGSPLSAGYDLYRRELYFTLRAFNKPLAFSLARKEKLSLRMERLLSTLRSQLPYQ